MKSVMPQNGSAPAELETPMIDYYLGQLEQAFSRIECDVQSLHEGENAWEIDPEDGMYVFRGFMHPFYVQKHVVDLLREVWHIYDGTREIINAKWQAGQVQVTDTDLDNGKGPGKAIVNKHVRSCRWVQLCGDLANLTKHYRLSHATKTGNGPPQLGDSMLTCLTSGKMEFGTAPDGSREIKLEKPVPMRPTLVVLNENGQVVGDAVEIALKARDSWLVLLRACGFSFER